MSCSQVGCWQLAGQMGPQGEVLLCLSVSHIEEQKTKRVTLVSCCSKWLVKGVRFKDNRPSPSCAGQQTHKTSILTVPHMSQLQHVCVNVVAHVLECCLQFCLCKKQKCKVRVLPFTDMCDIYVPQIFCCHLYCPC